MFNYPDTANFPKTHSDKKRERGGRMTKWKGKAASLSPGLRVLATSVSVIAMTTMVTAETHSDCTNNRGGNLCSEVAEEIDEVGIDAHYSGAPLVISAADVTAGVYGIKAVHDGAGDLSITSSGLIQNITDADGAAVLAKQNGSGDLNVHVVDVSGMKYGISVANSVGSGALSVVSTGRVQDQGLDAIRVVNFGSEGILIEANEVEGGVHGIYARNNGGGPVEITATGTVTGTSGSGIDAQNSYYGYGTELSITAVDVTGGTYGIKALNYGQGDLSIATTGLVENTINSPGSSAIRAYQNGAGKVDISVVDVRGAKEGLIAVGKTETESMSITSTGTVTGVAGDGLVADSRGDTVTIDVVNVTGGGTALVGRSWQNSELRITSSGTVSGGQDSAGIEASSFYGRSVTIDAHDVSGGAQGLLVHTESVETVNISLSGTVTGGADPAVDIYATGETAVAITLNEGATVRSANGQAIYEREDTGNELSAPDTVVTLNSGSTISGEIKLGDGSDRIVFAGGDFSAVTLFDGGDDTSAEDGFIDTISITSAIGEAGDLDRFQNWEAMELDGITLASDALGSSLIVGDGGVGTGLSLINGATLNAVSGFTLTGRMLIAQGSTFDASAGESVINGPVTNQGTITLQNGAAGEVLTINGDFDGSGVLAFDAVLNGDGSAADMITIDGDFNADAVIVVENIGGAGADTDAGIELLNVTGDFNGSAVLAGTTVTDNGEQAVVAGVYAYTLVQGADGSLRLVSENTDSTVETVTAFFEKGVSVYEIYPNVLHALNRLPSYHERLGALNASSPIRHADGRDKASAENPFWLRVSGAHEAIKTASSDTNSDAKVDHVKVELGAEIKILENGCGALFGGLVMSYGHAWGNISSQYRGGHINTDAYSVGLNGTWVTNRGFYIDAQTRYSWFWTDLKSDKLGELKSNENGSGIAASLEFGKRFKLQNGLSLVPQAQFYYSGVYFDKFTDKHGTRVAKRDGDEWIVRAGLFAEKTTSSKSTLYGLANVYYKINNSSRVDVEGRKIGNQSKNLSFELGFGGDARVAKNTRLFGEVAGRSSKDIDFSMRGTFGAKWTF